MPHSDIGGVKPRPVHFTEAIDFLRQKVNMPTRAWTDLWQGMHARAFVVAGATKDALLADFRGAIDKAISQGTTLNDFRKDFDKIVKRHGWSYKGARGWRTRVIFQTNVRMAYSAGRWAQIQRLKSRRPFIRYVAVLDARTRPDHRQWHGTVLEADDNWWSTHHPPNGWGCRCTVQSLSQRDLDRFGHEVSDKPPPGRTVTKTINTPAGPVDVKVPEGIDPGFAYNVGEAAWGRQISSQAMSAWRKEGGKAWQQLTPGDWRQAGRSEIVPADRPKARLGPPAKSPADMTAAVRRAIGGDEKVFDLPDGSSVMVNAESLGGHLAPARAPFVPFIAEVLEDPYEVWLSFERHRGTGKVELRKRIVKVVDLPRRASMTVVAQVARGRIEAWTLIPSTRPGGINRSRVGQLVFGK